MKKVMIFLAFAAMCFTANAQDLKTYDGPNSINQYPADFEPQDPFDGDEITIWQKDDNHTLEIYIQEDYATIDGLADQGEGMRNWKISDFNDNPTGWKADDVVVKGNIMYFRATKEGICSYEFVVNFKGRDCFRGEMKFPVSEEAKYKPMLETILSSLKKK
jgi:hypothetical protein